jgi:hypothetical protein
MKEKYVKPEIITRDFSFQIFLYDCWFANDGSGLVVGDCYDPDFGCTPCSFPGDKSNTGQIRHP